LEYKINEQNNIIFSTIKGTPLPKKSDNDFEKMFDDDINNFVDSEIMLDGNDESYLLTDNDESDISLII